MTAPHASNPGGLVRAHPSRRRPSSALHLLAAALLLGCGDGAGSGSPSTSEVGEEGAALGSGPSAPAPDEPRPPVELSPEVAAGVNVVFLLSDSHRADALGVAGHPLVRTPHLDRLAAEGVRFTNVVAQAPLSVPSRASILTGRYPELHRATNNRCSLPPEELTWAEHLVDSGYAAVSVGRVQGIYDGFEHVTVPGKEGDRRSFRSADESRPSLAYGRLDRDPDDAWDARIARSALDSLDELAQGDRPFALFVGLYSPHPPYAAPPPYDTLYGAADVSVPEPDGGKRPTYWQRNAARLAAPYDAADRAEVIARYLGLVTYLDVQVGRVLDRVDELGLADSTVVVYASDHGNLLFEHGLIGTNSSFFDEEVRVPAIVRFPPELPAGAVVDALVESIDLAPTLLALTGRGVPDSFLGRDLTGLARGEESPESGERAYASIDHTHAKSKPSRSYMVRTPGWLFSWGTGAEGELYDLASDPEERVNLYEDPEHRSKREEMWSLLIGQHVRMWSLVPERAASSAAGGPSFELLEGGRVAVREGDLRLELASDGARTLYLLPDDSAPVADLAPHREAIQRLEEALLRHVSLAVGAPHWIRDDPRELCLD